MKRSKNVPIEARTKTLQEYRSGLFSVEELYKKYSFPNRHIIQLSTLS